MLALPVITAAAIASALTVQAEPVPLMPLKEAARCAVIYDATVVAMAEAPSASDGQRRQAQIGWEIWHYELNSWKQEMSDAAIKDTLSAALGEVQADLPGGEGGSAAASRGQFLVSEMTVCREMIAANYGAQIHPIVARSEQASLAVQN